MESQSKISANPSWKESSSIIFVTPAVLCNGERNESQSPNLKYLITKRSEHHPFLATSICFPGGTVASADSSIQWQELFEFHGQDLFSKQFMNPAAHIPNIYREQHYLQHSISVNVHNIDVDNSTTHKESDKNQIYIKSHIPKQSSLRITGIRETFEECGILLCKPFPRPHPQRKSSPSADEKEKRHIHVNVDSTSESCTDTIPLILTNEQEIRFWQDKVRKNPQAFLTLCQHFSCLPDLDSLVEWSNWLSPRGLTGTRRFDTIFYMRFSPHPLPTIIDPREVAYAQWTSASDILDSHHQMLSFLPPPQFYEMTRLKNIQHLDELKSMALLRKQIGLETWCPLYYSTDDGFIATLPGDKLYTDKNLEEDTFTLEMLPMNNKFQGNDEKQAQHRLEMKGFRVIKLTATTPYRFGQRYPNLDSTGAVVTTIALKSSL